MQQIEFVDLNSRLLIEQSLMGSYYMSDERLKTQAACINDCMRVTVANDKLTVSFSLSTLRASFEKLQFSPQATTATSIYKIFQQKRNKILGRFVQSHSCIEKFDLPHYFAVNLVEIYIKFDFFVPCESA